MNLLGSNPGVSFITILRVYNRLQRVIVILSSPLSLMFIWTDFLIDLSDFNEPMTCEFDFFCYDQVCLIIDSNNYIFFIQDQAILRYVCNSLVELRDTTDPRNIDPEAYLRLVLLARGVAVARPQHLVKYSAPTPARPENGMEGFAILVFFNNISSFSPVFPFYMSHV